MILCYSNSRKLILASAIDYSFLYQSHKKIWEKWLIGEECVIYIISQRIGYWIGVNGKR